MLALYRESVNSKPSADRKSDRCRKRHCANDPGIVPDQKHEAVSPGHMNKHASGAGFNTAMVHPESLNGNSNDKNGKVDPQSRQGEWPISEERHKNGQFLVQKGKTGKRRGTGSMRRRERRLCAGAKRLQGTGVC
jgi:hypothetical protein